MLDFLRVTSTIGKNGVIEIYPSFIVGKSSDLMIRGGDFYAVWDEERNTWSTEEDDAIRLIDKSVQAEYEKQSREYPGKINVKYMWDADSGVIDKWRKYTTKQLRDNFHMLNNDLVFLDDVTTKESYSSKRLPYNVVEGSTDSWDELIGTLYAPEEKNKIEWCLGAIVSGESKKIQKFAILYGSHGTGKSTVLDIIEKMFQGYTAKFDAAALGNKNASFSLEVFKNNPLVAIQHDGNLSRIEDNTKLNSLVSHEEMNVNEKYSKLYSAAFSSFLILGSNSPVRITDSKSGLIRRLIEISPTGNLIEKHRYNELISNIDFELGAIAYKCKEFYLNNKDRYDNYIPLTMMQSTNDFFNFMEDSYFIFKDKDGTSVSNAWEMYNKYCDYANVKYKHTFSTFRTELDNYFDEFYETYQIDGKTIRGYFKGFKTSKFQSMINSKEYNNNDEPKYICADWLNMKEQDSIFDGECFDCNAQYASKEGTPLSKWDNVTTRLCELNTSELHYVRVPENHIVVDFDIPDEDNNKCLQKNLEAASKFPKTYAELSKSGGGIHLHYIYDGDVENLSRIYDDHIEIKIYNGKSSLRRKLTKCNDLPINHISSGLPLKKEAKMINISNIKDEKHLRVMIKKNLLKEIHDSTKCSIDFIKKLLDDAYESGMTYDVSDLSSAVMIFATNSTNQSHVCMKTVNEMHFKSKDVEEGRHESHDIEASDAEKDIVFFDIEVLPNVLLVVYKKIGDDTLHHIFNPTKEDLDELFSYKLVGFNNRGYDNHILYAAYLGYTNEEIYSVSKRIIGGDPNAKFAKAYNLSYTDIYDYAKKKQSLKKWEIELGLFHDELEWDWDTPMPEDEWETTLLPYCEHDVIATSAVWQATEADFAARQIQVTMIKALHGDSVNASVNMTTNNLSQKLIFGNNTDTQAEMNWRDMSKPVGSDQYEEYKELFGDDYNFRVFNDEGLPEYRDYIPGETLPEGWSILPFFKGYKFEYGKSTYLGQEIGEGGRVYTEPGMYSNVWDGDITSQHPHSIKMEVLFGPRYTKAFYDLVTLRVLVKSGQFDKAGEYFDGALKPYLNPEYQSGLADALKIVINSVYGLTSAKFENAFRDPRNIDNIVAKRGALFMTLLKDQIEKQGYKVCHIKTDSIKVPDYDEYIKDFIIKFGKEYGYNFETEAIFERYCLVDKAQYVGYDVAGDEPEWVTTGTSFIEPYIRKTLFTKELLEFEDYQQTKQVSGKIYLDFSDDDIVAETDIIAKKLDKWCIFYRGEKQKERIATVDTFEGVIRDANGNTMSDEQAIDLFTKCFNSFINNTGASERTISKYSIDEIIRLYEAFKDISHKHKYQFVGKIGSFIPCKSGGIMYGYNGTKLSSVQKTKGYRFKESGKVDADNYRDEIDMSYFTTMADDIINMMSKLGDPYWMMTGEGTPPMNYSPKLQSPEDDLDDISG